MTDLPSYQTLLVDNAEGITTITFNRPEKRNAMSPQLHRDMYDLLLRLESHADTRVLVITGAGPAFCAGQDLKEYFHELKDDEAESRRIIRISQDWRDRILRMFPKPTIAMINGYCFGGAFTTVCSADFAIAAEDATFGLSEINFGQIPAGLVGKVVTGVLGWRDASYYCLTGEQFSGKQAAEMRFINKAVPKEQLREVTWELAHRLVKIDAAAYRATKEGLREVRTMDHEQAYFWLLAKNNELKWMHEREGRGNDGIERFLAKQYRPGLGSFTETEQSGG